MAWPLEVRWQKSLLVPERLGNLQRGQTLCEAQIRSTDSCPIEISVKKHRSPQVGLAEIHSGQVGSPEIHLGKIRPLQIGRKLIRVFLPPLVPNLDSQPEKREILCLSPSAHRVITVANRRQY